MMFTSIQPDRAPHVLKLHSVLLMFSITAGLFMGWKTLRIISVFPDRQGQEKEQACTTV